MALVTLVVLANGQQPTANIHSPAGYYPCDTMRRVAVSSGTLLGDDVCADRIVLNTLDIRVPKVVPLLELFSSNGGTFQFQRRNSLVPAEELLGGRALGRGLRVSEWK